MTRRIDQVIPSYLNLNPIIEAHPRTPEDVGAYDWVAGIVDDKGRPLPWMDEESGSEIIPMVEERHGGMAFRFGWCEDVGVVVLWPDAWTGTLYRAAPPILP
jgi:hypothetical protein